jgi:predicted transcriptional regulator
MVQVVWRVWKAQMAERNKIDKYGYGDRVVELFRDGRTTVEIAELMTKGLVDSGLNDSIDQSTVSRWLKRVKDADADAQAEIDRQTMEVIRRTVEDGVSEDLGQIETVQGFFLGIVEECGADGRPKYDIRTRMEAGRSLVKVIDTKLRLPGVMPDEPNGQAGGDKPAIPAGSNVHSILERTKRFVGSRTGLRTEDTGAA